MSIQPTSVLTEPYLYSILNFLAENGKAICQDFRPLGAHFNTLTRVLDRAVDTGILKYSIRKSGRRVPVYSLTEKGWMVYHCMKYCYDVVEDGNDPSSTAVYEAIIEDNGPYQDIESNTE